MGQNIVSHKDDWFKFKNPYMGDREVISFLQRRIIVASICYYQFNISPITDFTYEKISRQLIRCMKQADEEDVKKSDYYYVFKDYDGSTGFDLYYRLNERDREYLKRIAWNVKGGN